MYKLAIVILFLWSTEAHSQTIDQRLSTKIEALIKDFGGDIGVYIKCLKNNKVVSLYADSVFPTASIVKIPILWGVMEKLSKGEFDYHQILIYRDSLAYSESDITTNLKDSARIELAKVILLMLSTSDNTASLWLQKLAGTGTRINELLSAAGFVQTRVNSRTPGREANRLQYGWGQIITDSISKKMMRLLGRNYWDEQALSQIPAPVFVASKNGAVDASRSEVLLVMAKKPYILSIFTKNNKDKSWTANNEAWLLTKKISALVWKYFN
jgi:beta-lactamase class A